MTLCIHSELEFSVTSIQKELFQQVILKDLVLKYMTYDIVYINKQHYYNFQINVTVS